MAKSRDVEALLARSYGPGQQGLSADDEARLAALNAPSQHGVSHPRKPVELLRSFMPKVLCMVAVVTTVLAGAAGYVIGSTRSDKQQLGRVAKPFSGLDSRRLICVA